MDDNLQIRIANQIEKEILYDEFKNDEELKKYINFNMKRLINILASKQMIIGFFEVLYSKGDPEIQYAVIKSQRGKGYGKILLKKATEYCMQSDNQKIYLSIDAQNIPSIMTAKSVGYKIDDNFELDSNNRITYSKINPLYRRGKTR